MLPSVVATGISRPAWMMPRKMVAIGVPVLHAISASGLAALMRSIWAVTLTSVVLKWPASTILTSLFSGIWTTFLRLFSASWPLASVDVMVAIFVQPLRR